MARTYVYIVSDSFEIAEKAKTFFSPLGINVQTFTTAQWKEGLENPTFRAQMSSGVPALASGIASSGATYYTSSSSNNVLPFPGNNTLVDSTTSAAAAFDNNNPPTSALSVSTIEEVEYKMIEKAIYQFKGNLTEAAKALGIGRATLYRKVKQFHIDPAKARKRRNEAA